MFKRGLKKIRNFVIEFLKMFDASGVLGLIFLGWIIWMINAFGIGWIKIIIALFVIGIVAIVGFIVQGIKDKKDANQN
jgi:hypothetical protein